MRLHDSTEFSVYGESPQELGAAQVIPKGRHGTVCGPRDSDALQPGGYHRRPGVGALRDQILDTRSLQRDHRVETNLNPTRVPIGEKECVRWLENLRTSTKLLGEASNCLHIWDRESDIYEICCNAQDEGTNFLIRTCVDRLSVDVKQTISAAMKDAKAKAIHHVEVRDGKERVS